MIILRSVILKGLNTLRERVNHSQTPYQQIDMLGEAINQYFDYETYQFNLADIKEFFEYIFSQKMKIDKSILDDWLVEMLKSLDHDRLNNLNSSERITILNLFIFSIKHRFLESTKFINNHECWDKIYDYFSADLSIEDIDFLETLFKNKTQNIKRQYYPNDPINFSIMQLPVYLQEKLRKETYEKIETLFHPYHDLQIKNELIRFMSDSQSLPFKKMNRLSITMECIEYIFYPKKISQHETSLCGVAALMQRMAIDQRNYFIRTIIEIAELSLNKIPVHLPEQIKSLPEDANSRFENLTILWMSTVKHNFNQFMSYSPYLKSEELRGVTPPAQLEKMFAAFHFDVISDNFQIRFKNNGKSEYVLEQARKFSSMRFTLPSFMKIYGQKHVEVHDDQVRFDQFSNWVEKNNPEVVTILIKDIFDPFSQLDFIESSHYVNIREFKVKQDSMVSFKMMTYGDESEVTVPQKIFCNSFLGAIYADVDQKFQFKNQVRSFSVKK